MATEQANDGGFNFDRANQLIEAFLHRQGGVCEAHKIVGLCPEVRNLLSGRRLVPFLQRFPEKYRLEQAQPEIMAVRVLTEKAAVEPAEVTRILSGLSGGSQYDEGLLQALKAGIEFYKDKQKTPHAPLRWLYAHRSVPKCLKGWSNTHPVPEWQYHLLPGFGGYKDANEAKTKSLLRYLEGFVDANPAELVWGSRDDGYVDIAAGAAPAVQKTDDHGRAKRAKLDHQAAALSSVSHGTWLLCIRVSTRLKELYALELSLYAQLCGLPSVKELRVGLMVVPSEGKKDEAWLPKLKASLPFMTSVRRLCRALVVGNAEALDEFADGVRKEFLPRESTAAGPDVQLSFEVHYPDANQSTLPFVDVTSHARLLSTVMSAIGTERVSLECEAAPGANTRRVVLTSTKDGLLLLSEEVSATGQKWRGWSDRWDSRPFFFSGSMEASVAAATVSIASAARALLLADTGVSDDEAELPGDAPMAGNTGLPPARRFEQKLVPDVVVDACCGSGTLAAAAACMGARRVVGLEIRADFASRLPQNWAHCAALFGSDRLAVFHHDSTKPAPGPVAEEVASCKGPCLVLCNAPWGKKFGSDADCFHVVRGVLSLYRAAVICFVTPVAVLDVVEREFGLNVLHVASLGGNISVSIIAPQE
ncbi:hypothetical protein DIPPA_32675 [Diplonema papillatum]|nr:hypothetical protein DIPPA_32675 [Diplonema papillatum]